MSQNQLTIDRAKPEDAAAILHLKRAAWLAAYPNEEHDITYADIDKKLPEDSLPAAIKNWQRGIASETEDGERVTFVARLNGKVVGFTAPQTENGQRRLGALYVDPDFQGQGVGGKLLQKAIDWHGTDHDIYLRVVSYNESAIRFYEHRGFRKTGLETPEEFDEEQGIKLLPETEMVLKCKN